MDKFADSNVGIHTILVKNIHFAICAEFVPTTEKMPLPVTVDINRQIGDDELTIEITVSLFEKMERTGKPFDLVVTMMGIFGKVDKSKPANFQLMADGNGPALIFPYIRELITNITMRVGFPIYLNPENMFKMIDNMNKEKQKA